MELKKFMQIIFKFLELWLEKHEKQLLVQFEKFSPDNKIKMSPTVFGFTRPIVPLQPKISY